MNDGMGLDSNLLFRDCSCSSSFSCFILLILRMNINIMVTLRTLTTIRSKLFCFSYFQLCSSPPLHLLIITLHLYTTSMPRKKINHHHNNNNNNNAE